MHELRRKLTSAAVLLPLLRTLQLLSPLSVLTTASAVSLLAGCKADAQGQKPALTEQQRRLNNIGLGLVVDAVEGAEMLGVEFFADEKEAPFYAKSRMVRTNREIMTFPASTVPEQVRVVWRKKDYFGPPWWSQSSSRDDFGNAMPRNTTPNDGRIRSNAEYLKELVDKRKLIAKNIGYVHQGPWGGQYFGEVVGDYIIPIASRIPDEVVKDIRKNGGGLRLKFRLKPDGVMFGWDIERFGGGLSQQSMPGGDFLDTRY